MFQKKLLFIAIALAAAVGLSASPLWSQGIPDLLEKKERPKSEKGATGAEGGIGADLGLGARAGAELTSEDVKKVQDALKDKGHDPGPVDGVLGPQTQEALKSFQMASGLKASGKVDAETAAKLGIDMSSSSEASGIN